MAANIKFINCITEYVHKEKIVIGDYVFTPCKNAFNNKMSYWVSKKGYMLAVYAFSPMDSSDLKELTSEECLNSYIKLFDNMVERIKE